MSAWSDWKAGLIEDAEYTRICAEEDAQDRYWDEHPEEFNEEDEDDIDEW